jgi:hypothetical protein
MPAPALTGVLQVQGIQQFGDRLPDGSPVRLVIVAGSSQRLPQEAKTAVVAQFRQAGLPQQGAQGRVSKCRLVEFGEVLVATVVAQEQRVAQVVQGRSLLPGRQRPVGGAGEIPNTHESLFRAALPRVRQAAHFPPCGRSASR